MLSDPFRHIAFGDDSAVAAFPVNGLNNRSLHFRRATVACLLMAFIPLPNSRFMLAFVLSNPGSPAKSVVTVAYRSVAHRVIIMHHPAFPEFFSHIAVPFEETLQVCKEYLRPVA